jgi:histidine ammonia-lyase
MLAIGILAVARAERLVRTADVTAAMSVEAALGSDRVFDERLTALRPHPGVVASASNLRRLLEGSAIVASHRDSTHLVQDAYSLRCSPQVNGATREVLRFVRGVLEVEANAVSDNPIVLPDDDEVLSGGNFHGQPVAVALDALAAAIVPLASIAERRLYRLLDPTRNNGLPPFLVAESGLNSGFMLVQYTAASLVSECKTLAHPASVDSIGSSAGQEDHVSMGMTAARHARDVVSNAEVVIALEALVAAQALDLRAPLEPAAATGAARGAIRERVAFLDATASSEAISRRSSTSCVRARSWRPPERSSVPCSEWRGAGPRTDLEPRRWPLAENGRSGRGHEALTKGGLRRRGRGRRISFASLTKGFGAGPRDQSDGHRVHRPRQPDRVVEPGRGATRRVLGGGRPRDGTSIDSRGQYGRSPR